jgi:hypothetical protein
MGLKAALKKTYLYPLLLKGYLLIETISKSVRYRIRHRKNLMTNKRTDQRDNSLPVVACVLSNHDQTVASYPYLYCLALGFVRSGFRFLINDDYETWRGVSPYSAPLFSTDGIMFMPAAHICKIKTELLITDNLLLPGQRGCANTGRIVEISSDILKRIADPCCEAVMPFFMHPEIYHGKYDEMLIIPDNHVRHCRIFWSGNTDAESYQNGAFGDIYQMLSRTEIMEAIKEELSDEELIVNPPEGFPASGYTNKLVLMDWSWTKQSSRNMEYRIPREKWLQSLSFADFFLGCPGVNIPLCHNIIEAMAAGCIPLINWADYFHPPLENNRNCITFGSREELIRKIRLIRNMGGQEIALLRQGVKRYYDTYLLPQAFAKKLMEQPDLKKVYFYATGSSLAGYRQRNRAEPDKTETGIYIT